MLGGVCVEQWSLCNRLAVLCKINNIDAVNRQVFYQQADQITNEHRDCTKREQLIRCLVSNHSSHAPSLRKRNHLPPWLTESTSTGAFQCGLLLVHPLMTIGHKAGHYCHFRVLRSVNSDTGWKKKKWKEKKTENRSLGVNWEGDDTFDFKPKLEPKLEPLSQSPTVSVPTLFQLSANPWTGLAQTRNGRQSL